MHKIPKGPTGLSGAEICEAMEDRKPKSVWQRIKGMCNKRNAAILGVLLVAAQTDCDMDGKRNIRELYDHATSDIGFDTCFSPIANTYNDLVNALGKEQYAIPQDYSGADPQPQRQIIYVDAVNE